MRSNTLGSIQGSDDSGLPPIQGETLRKTFHSRQKAIEKRSQESSSNNSSINDSSAITMPDVSDADQMVVSSSESESSPSKANIVFKEIERDYGWTKSNYRLSMSLPSLSKKWQAFEFDPEDDIDADLITGKYGRKKRAISAAGELKYDLEKLRGNQTFMRMLDKDHMKPSTSTDNIFLTLNTPNPSPIVSPMNGSPMSSTISIRFEFKKDVKR